MLEETEQRANTFRALAKAMGVAVSRAHELSKEAWFPKRGEDGRWNIDECLRAVAKKRRGEGAVAAKVEAPDLTASPNELIAAKASAAAKLVVSAIATPAEDADLLAVLGSETDPTKLARAAAPLAARMLARTHKAGDAGESAKAVQMLSRALEELRRNEADAVELAKDRGSLIERDAAKACMGELASRFVRALERLEARLATQVEAWIADEGFRTGAAEDRQREVRAWAAKQTAAGRNEEADEQERMIATEIADRKGT